MRILRVCRCGKSWTTCGCSTGLRRMEVPWTCTFSMVSSKQTTRSSASVKGQTHHLRAAAASALGVAQPCVTCSGSSGVEFAVQPVALDAPPYCHATRLRALCLVLLVLRSSNRLSLAHMQPSRARSCISMLLVCAIFLWFALCRMRCRDWQLAGVSYLIACSCVHHADR